MEPYSLDTIKMARRGDVFTQDKDKKILVTIDATQLIETDFQKVDSNATLGNLVELISKSKRNIFPVVDSDGKLLGIISLDNIREIIFKRELYDSVKVQELMVSAPAMVFQNESTEGIMKKFDETGAWNLPVVNSNDQYIGFISKSRMFSSYRTTLQTTTI